MNQYDEQKLEQRLERLEQEIETEQKLQPIILSELMAKQFSETEWVVSQLAPAEGTVAISGAPATYKTWLVLSVAVAVAQGDILFDKFLTAQSAVLVVDEENGERLLQRRLQKLCKNTALPIYFLSLGGFKLLEGSIETLVLFAKEKGVKLVIFDSLVRIHSADENDTTKMAKVFHLLKRFNKEGLAVVFTHHNRKQGIIRSNPSQDMRGSSDILASVDCHLAVERKPKEEFLTITQTKLRQGEETKPFKLTIINDENELKFEYAGEVDEVQTRKADFKAAVKDILEQMGKPMFQKELFETIREAGVEGGYSTFKTALKEMTERGELFVAKGRGNTTLYSLQPFSEEQMAIAANSGEGMS